MRKKDFRFIHLKSFLLLVYIKQNSEISTHQLCCGHSRALMTWVLRKCKLLLNDIHTPFINLAYLSVIGVKTIYLTFYVR